MPNHGVSGDQQQAVCIVVDPANRDNGATELFPRLHGKLLPSPPEADNVLDDALVAGISGYCAELAAGDALFVHSL